MTTSSRPLRTGLGAALVTAGLCAGCSATVDLRGNLPDPELVEEIQIGRSSHDAVSRAIGTASTVATFDQDTWYYIGKKTETTSFFKPTVIDQKVLMIRFTKAGVVEEIRWFDKEDGRDIQMVSRITPTRGKDLGILEQLLGNVGKFSSGPPQSPTPDN